MRILTGTFLAALLLNEAAPAAQRPQDTRANGGDKKTKLRFTVGKETTYVTRPVDRDGYIDYVAALNGQLRSGVTPDNNAAVLLWKAMGPRPEKSNMPPEFFRWLGSPAPPEVGDYHLPLNRFLTDRLRLDQKQITAVHEQLEAACRRPWTAKQYPHLAGIAIETMACDADLVLLDRTKLDAKTLQSYLTDLQKLPPMPPLADVVDLFERFGFLEAVMLVNRHGFDHLGTIAGGGTVDDFAPGIARFAQDIDWDPALRAGNQWCDRLAAAVRLTERSARAQRLTQLAKELKDLKAKMLESGALAEAVSGKGATPQTRGKAVGELLITLTIPALD